MTVNNVNGAQPKLYTFAEMGYMNQTPQTQAPVAPQAPDTVEIAGGKPKKKVSKGVIAAVVTVAVAALAAFGLAKTGKKVSGSEKLFTLSNFKDGFNKIADDIISIPGKIWNHFKHGGEGAPAPEPAPAPAPAPGA